MKFFNEIELIRKLFIVLVTQITIFKVINEKNKLKGAIHFFTGERNNMAIYILNGENETPAGGMYITPEILEQLEEVIGKENVKLK